MVKPQTQRTLFPKVNRQACRGCKRCLGARVCETGALQNTAPGSPPLFDIALCEGCLDCVMVCPVGALTAEDSGDKLL